MPYKALRKQKIHFMKHYKKLPGRPDKTRVRSRKAVFIDGDFWHGWKFHRATGVGEPGKWLVDGILVFSYTATMTPETEDRRLLVERVQTSVRMEKRILKVL